MLTPCQEESLRIKLGKLNEAPARSKCSVGIIHGLCNYLKVRSIDDFCTDDLGCDLKNWPLYSGNSVYPVPHPSDVLETAAGFEFQPSDKGSAQDRAETAYQHSGWYNFSHKSKYGRIRFQLVEWLKERIREKLEREG